MGVYFNDFIVFIFCSFMVKRLYDEVERVKFVNDRFVYGEGDGGEEN